MTAETDLLPLPRTLADWIAERCEDALDAGDVTDFVETYARANLAELQREVEGLRAQNAAAKEMLNRPAHAHLRGAHLHGRVAGCLLCDAMADRERLAGALRGLLNVSDKFTGDPDEDAATWVAANDAARAALDQETTNG